MVESTARSLTDVQAFLAHVGEPDTRYELIGGEIVAKSPPKDGHARIAGNAAIEIGRRLDGREPCGVMTEAGVMVSDNDYYVADLLVACAEARPEAGASEPKLIVEVLSPSTRAHDRGVKVPAYCDIDGVEEIWLISSMRRHVQLWCRQSDGWLVRDFVEGASFASAFLHDQIALTQLYRHVVLDDNEATDAAT